MKRLILGSVLLAPFCLMSACSGDPTENLRAGVEKLNPAPSQLFLPQGRTANVDVTATDAQGNQIETAFAISNVGAGISVERDLTFRTAFVNDSQAEAPATDALFRFRVTANDLTPTSFTITAEGKSVDVPVNVIPAADATPAVFTRSGPNATDTAVITLPNPFRFRPDAAVNFNTGAAIVVGRAADSTSVTILPPPGANSPATIDSAEVTFYPGLAFSVQSADTLVISPTVAAMPGTDLTATAPTVADPGPGGLTAFYDAGTFTGADITADGGDGAQYYKFTLANPADVTINLNAQGAGGDTDVDLILCSDATCSDGGDLTAADVGQPETGTFTLVPGTYYIAVVLFGTAPGSISLAISE